jgi:hypothetical protein
MDEVFINLIKWILIWLHQRSFTILLLFSIEKQPEKANNSISEMDLSI